MVAPVLDIGGRMVGIGHPCFVIAEAGVNHNGDPAMAKRLIDAAAEAGADAVKFQTFSADRLVTPEAPKAEYQKRAGQEGDDQYAMLKVLELSDENFRELADYCADRDILFLSTPFDEQSADFLEGLGVAAFKIPSGELTNHPFLAHVASKGRPIILSTGMSVMDEVTEAVQKIRDNGDPQLALLHCVSSYPADPADCNLRAMHSLSDAFNVPVGFSDHTLGISVSLAAVALGACVIEKHFTLDRNLPGPDHAASALPEELASLVRGIRRVEAALGDGSKVPTASERDVASVARKSLVANEDLASGTVLERSMVAVRRPGTGMPPSALNDILGRTLARDISRFTLLSEEMFR